MRCSKTCFMPLTLFALPLLLLITLSSAQASQQVIKAQSHAVTDEQYAYVMSYRGLFSSFVWIDIADIEVRRKPAKAPLDTNLDVYHLSVNASTERYRKAELLYPVRYQYESYILPDLSKTLLVNEQSKLSDPSHELVLFDWQSKQAEIFKQADDDDRAKQAKLPPKALTHIKQKQAKLPLSLTQQLSADGNSLDLIYDETNPVPLNERTIDPLGMLFSLKQRLVDEPLSEKQVMSFPVVIGDDFMEYEARLIGPEKLRVGKTEMPSIKVQLRGRELSGDKPEEWGRSFTVWFSDDANCVPLKLENSVTLGVFTVEMVAKPTPLLARQ